MRAGRFIWLASQRVDHAAGFASLRGGPTRREEEGVNRWVLARGAFEATEAGEAKIEIAVDGRYRMWLNGVRVGDGPARSTPNFARHDERRVPTQSGRNVIAVLIHVPGVDLAWYERMRGGWQPVFGDGALGVQVNVRGRQFIADESWRMVESDAWDRATPRRGWGQDFIEAFDARKLDPCWTAPEFDDSIWPQARAMVAEPADEVRARGWGRVVPFPALAASELPSSVEREVAPEKLLWSRGAEATTDDLATRLYTMKLGAATPFEDGVVCTQSGAATSLMFVFPYHAGRPFIEIEAKGGEVIDIAVAEALPGEFGRGQAGDGLRDEGHLGAAQLVRYIARPGVQCFERFDWTAVRAMQIVVHDAPKGLRFAKIGSVATHYPALDEGAFACSDPLLEKLWRISRDTVRECMHDAWVDCPGREARQWVGDPAVMFDVAALGFGPSVFPLHRNFLAQVAESQRQDGLVRMFAPGDIEADALTIPDFTLLWIVAAERYWRASGDLAAVAALLPAIERGLDRFARWRGANGLVADVPHWHFIEWADLDRRAESAAINALYAGALAAAAAIADAAGRDPSAWRAERATVVTALDARHWDESRGLYVDSVDPDSGERHVRASQHANALMLLLDLAPAERIPRILAAITDRDRLKLTAAPPIVTASGRFDEAHDIVLANSFFSHFVWAGIAHAGDGAWVIEELRRAYSSMLDAGATTLWESFAPTASLCHGFSATPLFQLSSIVLGVRALLPGYSRFALDPEHVGLDHASGIVPTPHGPITIAWTRENDRLKLELSHPPACVLDRHSIAIDLTILPYQGLQIG